MKRLVLLLLLTGCASSGGRKVERGVPEDLARHRAATLSDIRYKASFVIPEKKTDPIRGSVEISFRLKAGGPVVLDFDPPASLVDSVHTAAGKVKAEIRDGHILLPGTTGRNSFIIYFTAGDGPLNRNPEYLYTLFVPDRASHCFPCFDQPDLKARYTLQLTVPPSWKAVANGAPSWTEKRNDATVITFNETPPLPTYLFAFAAGKFEIITENRAGRIFRMFHRETDEEKVKRNVKAVFDLHGAALEWLEHYTDIKHPFEKFDFVLIPTFQYNGMEHPGQILYRSSRLFLDKTATQQQKLKRASLIAHETAHMWFGNLVTMEWFNDVWMKEVFANFMAAKIVNPSFPEVDHKLRFLLAHYPPAYAVDRTEGANPIRQELDNLNQAGTLYGAIIYRKAPVVMKHLERIVGEAKFREGVRKYLKAHSFANATWPDLIEVLDELSEEDLRAWSRMWVEEPGRPVVTPELVIGDDGNIRSLTIRTKDWPQQVNVLLSIGGEFHEFPVHLRGPTEVPEVVGKPEPEFLLVNGHGIGYGRFELDEKSRGHLLKNLPFLKHPRLRAIAWLNLWDAMLEQQVAPRDLLNLAMKMLERTDVELNVQMLLGAVRTIYWRFLRVREVRGLEALLWKNVEGASTSSLKSAYFQAWRSIVTSEDGVERLRSIRDGGEVRGLTFSEEDRMKMALELAVRGVNVLDAQEITNPDRKRRFDFVKRAAHPDRTVRDAFFESLKDERNRETEPWVVEALTYLHHPLRADDSLRYVRPSLDLVEEIQRTGDIFFPKRWLDATLGGHRSKEAGDIVRGFLESRPNYPFRLRLKILQSADMLFRASRP